MIGIINSSPLIYLGKLGLLDNLLKIFSKIVTTSIVIEEILSDKTAPERISIEKFVNQNVIVERLQNPEIIETYDKLLKIIHPGEASVISLGLYHKNLPKKQDSNVTIIIDDSGARDIAKSFGLEMIGTLGLLIKFKRMNLFNKAFAIEKLKQLITQTDFWITPSLLLKIMEELNTE
jgi:predicted nucleic acid-binding protein